MLILMECKYFIKKIVIAFYHLHYYNFNWCNFVIELQEEYQLNLKQTFLFSTFAWIAVAFLVHTFYSF